MRLIGRLSLSTSSVVTAAAFVLVSAMVMLAPTEASAQFNIEGMIRGAIGHGYGHRSRGGGSRHSRGHSSSKHEHDDSDSAADKGKDKDALDEQASSHDAKSSDTKPDAKLSRRLPSGSSRDAAQASDTTAAKPGRVSDDEPSFAPSR